MGAKFSLERIFSVRNLGVNQQKIIHIERIAIDQSGSLGSLYDAYQDQILGKLSICYKLQTSMSEKPVKCILYKGRTFHSQNLLQMIDIDCSLRLSIALKMVKPTGVALLIDNPRSIDKFTRFLYFYQETRIESCHDDFTKRRKSLKSSLSGTFATHIITEVTSGIHVVIALQLSPNEEGEIDSVLDQICHSLIDDSHIVEMTSKTKHLLDRITSTTVYSNISDLTKLTKLDDIYERIVKMKRNFNDHRRLKYKLTSIQSFYPQYAETNKTKIQVNEAQIEELEQYILQQSSELKVLKFLLDFELPELLQGKLEEQINDAQQDLSKIKEQHESDIQRICHLVIELRKGRMPEIPIDEQTSLDPPKEIKDRIDNIIRYTEDLKAKGNLIKNLQNDGFEYCNVTKLAIGHGYNQELIKNKLFRNDLNKAIFCSTDLLKNRFQEVWNTLYSQMIETHREKPHLNLVYADFTYSTYYLGKMVILSSIEQMIEICESTSEASSSHKKRKAPSLPFSSSNEYINILLIGESGVGKSTFINAFANYLRFETLEQAQNGQPIVIIPVSFLLTVNDDFDEHIIKFGDLDSNEDHNNSGQSVTQQCRSYVSEICDGKKLRIIDTPGFGDTRGENQDDLNMKMIFSFINNLTYLNGICLLFKPNVAQLNPFLYSCCSQLFHFFGENIRHHFIFCFTNARSTFFTPGDTRPLLKLFFDSFPVKDIPLEKKNTFCFDSEPFRYLVALQKALKFNEDDENEFKKSWLRSVIESKRFRDFLCKQLHPYRKIIEWQSNEEAQFRINFMIRPMLEAIRNILRNILLYEKHCSIKVKATRVDRPTVICYTCDRIPEKCGDFWILSDHLHKLPSTCTSNEQTQTEYRLDYEFLNDQTIESNDILNEQRKLLYETCARFARFLLNIHAYQDDSFLSGFVRMIEEEKSICQKQNPSIFNRQLVDELEKLKKEYERKFNVTHLDIDKEILSETYKLIMSINEISTVKEQIDAIKDHQQLLLTFNEQNFTAEQTRF